MLKMDILKQNIELFKAIKNRIAIRLFISTED